MKGKVRRSLRASIYDGILAAAGGSVTDQFIAPFAIALQANAAQIANLASLPGLIGSAAQLQAGFVSNHFHRRRAPMIAGIVVQIGCFFALAAVPWLGGVPAMVSLMVVYTAAGCLSAPLWAGLMCE
ncbi:MAG TPA: hypothetical protein VMU17_01540, partial [Elusimicrobiota bacterium]|nr:hypothetical protein [Elusimicrobiota bacterium]